MGLERVERLKKDYPVEVRWLPFELHPETPKEGIFRDIPRDRWEGGIKVLAKEAGLVMEPPPLIANSHYALEAAEYARDQGRFDEFHLEAFRAYFEQGQNIGDLEVVKKIGEGCGLDGGELERHLKEGSYTQRVYQDKQDALKLGINAIPAYIIGNFDQAFENFLVLGAQPYGVFQQVMELVREKRSS